MKTIAVLIATYNGEKYLAALLDSLIRQTFKDFVCYIHDDGSTDDTEKIIDAYCSTGDLDIKVLQYPRTGSSKSNFMSMLMYADEPYVMFCDQDDVWEEDKIEISYNTMVQHEESGIPTLIFSDLYVVDNKLDIISESFMKYSGRDPYRYKLNQLLMENVAPGCTMIVNKKLYKTAALLDDYSMIVMHDYWMMLIAAASGKIVYIDRPLIQYRQHDSNSVGADKSFNTVQRINNVIRKTFNGGYRAFFEDKMNTLQRQAYAVSKLPDIPEDAKELCRSFYNISSKNKAGRVAFYLRNRVLKSSHNFWLLIWC